MIGRMGALLLLGLGGSMSGAASAQDAVAPHMEGCLVWYQDGNVAVGNECSRPLSLNFIAANDSEPTRVELGPYERFTSHAVWGQTPGFIFTACPKGLVPSVAFSWDNKDTIAASLYNCVPSGPTS